MTTEVKVLFVKDPIQVALFDLCVRPEFLRKDGKWGKQEKLLSEWVDVEVRLAPEGYPIGRTFEAQKTNWNLNDSNWVNVEKVFKKLSKVAAEANEGVEVPKKVLVGHLEDLKKTFAIKAA
jgi:hypothetical protein